MSGKVKRPAYKQMNAVLSECLRKYTGNAVFAVFLYTILRSAVYTVCVMPPAFIAYSSGESVSSFSFAGLAVIVLFVIATLLDIVLCYGLFCIFTRMVKKEYVTLGFLFYGFKAGNRKRAFSVAGIFAVIIFIFSLIVMAVSMIFAKKLTALVLEKTLETVVLYFAPVILILLLIFIMPFAFVHIIVSCEPETKVFSAFLKSVSVVFRNFFHFIGYMIYAAGVNLPVCIISTLLTVLLPDSGKSGTGVPELAGMLFSFVAFFSEIMVVVRVCFALPVYYLGWARLNTRGAENAGGAETVLVAPENAGEAENESSD